jgi:hypothetical protein
LNFIVRALVEAGNLGIGIGISYRLHGEFQEYETGDRWKADTSRLRFSFSKKIVDETLGNLGLRAQQYFLLRHRIFNSLTEDSTVLSWIHESICGVWR